MTPEGCRFTRKFIGCCHSCCHPKPLYLLTILALLPGGNKDIQKNGRMYFADGEKYPIKSLSPHVAIYVASLQTNIRQRQYGLLSVGQIAERNLMIMEKMMNTKTQEHTFTKKIGQTVYVVRYHFNEDAKETMQEKIKRMLVTEASRMEV